MLGVGARILSKGFSFLSPSERGVLATGGAVIVAVLAGIGVGVGMTSDGRRDVTYRSRGRHDSGFGAAGTSEASAVADAGGGA